MPSLVVTREEVACALAQPIVEMKWPCLKRVALRLQRVKLPENYSSLLLFLDTKELPPLSSNTATACLLESDKKVTNLWHYAEARGYRDLPLWCACEGIKS